MCGLAGFAGIKDHRARLNLVLGLGLGIDSRGKDAAGFLSINNGTPKYCKKLGTWQDARYRFWNVAAKGDICMMHARYATCGNKTIDEAHPFAIWRNNKVVLWGAHNGIIHTARESAKKHNRKFTVDSKELYELLADKDYEEFRKQGGYGVLTWIESDQRDRVYMTRLSSHSDICVVSIKGGGMVWGSTEAIIKNGVELAGLEIDKEWDVKEIGRVYMITTDGIYHTKQEGMCFNSSASAYSSSVYYHSGSHHSNSSGWSPQTGSDSKNGKSKKYLSDDDKYDDHWNRLKSKSSTTSTTSNKSNDHSSKLSEKEEKEFLKEYDLEKLLETWEKIEEEESESDEVSSADWEIMKNFMD